MCPPRYCKGAKRRRPDILPLLQNGRRDRLDRFFGAIKPGKPTLYLKHVLLPHGPYMFLPSGKQTRRTFRDPLPGMNGPDGFASRTLTEHNRQRLQLQIAFADREIGRMVARMKANGTYDKSLIAMTADHGLRLRGGRQGPTHGHQREHRRGRARAPVHQGPRPDGAAAPARPTPGPWTSCPRSPTS